VEDLSPSGGDAGAGQPTRHVDLAAAARAIEAFLTALGHPPSSDPELRETGSLVARAYHEELLAGYRMDPAEVLRDTLSTTSSGLVVVRDISVTCICPHHLLPASGVIHVGYYPNERIVGLGALARLARGFAARLILQETLCEQIAEALVRHLGARGAGCVAQLEPACLTTRGERAAHASVITTATSGVLRKDAALRSEFFAVLSGSCGPSERVRMPTPVDNAR
jgi:GTP cyclohydrolase I